MKITISIIPTENTAPPTKEPGSKRSSMHGFVPKGFSQAAILCLSVFPGGISAYEGVRILINMHFLSRYIKSGGHY